MNKKLILLTALTVGILVFTTGCQTSRSEGPVWGGYENIGNSQTDLIVPAIRWLF